MIQVAGIVAALYLVLLLAMFVFQRSIIYFPSTDIPEPVASGVPDMTVVMVTTGDGLDLSGWYRPARNGRPTILYVHGNAGHIGFRGEKVRAYLEAGLGVFLAEYRGYGGNPGSPSEDGLYRDGQAALDFLLARGIGSEAIVLYGESLGSGVAVELAHRMAVQDRPVNALVLEAPFTALPDVGARHYPWIPVRLLMKDGFRSVEKIADVQAPVFIVHGELDRVTPIGLAKRLFEVAREPKEAMWLPLAGHVDLYAHGAAGGILGFIESVNRPKTPLSA